MTISRRSAVKGATALGLAGFAARSDLFRVAEAWAQTNPWKPESGAELNLLRWKRFVQSEDDAFMLMIEAFGKATGVKVIASSESYDDVQPKASVAAHTGQGPDIVWGLHSLPHLFPDKCLDVSDVADHLGKQHGGWFPSAVAYGKSGGRWIAIPSGLSGTILNYRISSLEKAGFKQFPTENAAFLELCRALRKNDTPAGFAMGHASGDANNWLHWALWSHNAFLVDKDDRVVINSPETAKALDYVKALYETFIPGTASWNDGSNNKAFLSGVLHCTNNGISIYAAAKRENLAIAEDMDHAYFPVGPIGQPTELHLCFPLFAFKYTKAPNACKALINFFMDAAQYNPWLEAGQGFIAHFLKDYDRNPVWTSDPKRSKFRDSARRTLTVAGIGSLGDKATAAIADFIVVDMFANYVTGREDLKGAIAIAERQAKRLYRS